MKRYSAPALPPFELNEKALAADLEFPILPDFVSVPPRLDPQVMLQRIQETMAFRSRRSGEEERRPAEKVAVEFVL